ncbi:MAG: HD domain-containing protein [Anaerostipes sp.]|nr:HD domain-containing protein [Anaerostipes sp.]
MSIEYGASDIETPIRLGLEASLEHGIIVSNLAYLIGKELELDDELCHDLAVAGLVHDIGKIKLNFYMDEKEESLLTVDETRYMRMHPTIGYSVLIEHGYEQNVLDAVLYHHENCDGTGYPLNLKGDEIPFVARIMHVCDLFGALISNRPYREGFDVETAICVMIDDAKNFDMKVFLAFQRIVYSDEMKDLLDKSNLGELKEDIE